MSQLPLYLVFLNSSFGTSVFPLYFFWLFQNECRKKKVTLEIYAELLNFHQAPKKHQQYVASVLGLPMSKVVCKTKRIGGGFGGKETRSAFLAAVAAIPSYLLNRPVKITLDRDIDMMITGQRHSFLGKYKVYLISVND